MIIIIMYYQIQYYFYNLGVYIGNTLSTHFIYHENRSYFLIVIRHIF